MFIKLSTHLFFCMFCLIVETEPPHYIGLDLQSMILLPHPPWLSGRRGVILHLLYSKQRHNALYITLLQAAALNIRNIPKII